MELSDRMKFYEAQRRQTLMPQLPIIIRIDGKSFHSWTKGMERPFDDKLIHLFQLTTELVMKDFLVNATIAYGQSDEVTFVIPAHKISTQPFMGAKHDKLVSLTASAFTAAFAVAMDAHEFNTHKPFPMFDARCFNLPSDREVANNLLWRQQDATRNSIQMCGQSLLSHSQMQGLSNNQVQEELWKQHGFNWNQLPIHKKRGWTVVRRRKLIQPSEMADVPEEYRPTEPVIRRVVELDNGIPIFTADSEYIHELL